MESLGKYLLADAMKNYIFRLITISASLSTKFATIIRIFCAIKKELNRFY